MAYVGEVPWHRQGAEVPPDVSAEEMIQAAGLDWTVEKRPARGYPPIKRKRKPDTYAKYELVRMPRENTNEQEIVLGMVSDRYEPLQNVEAFQFFDALVERKVATFETAGALGAGERVWVMAKMPEVIQVVRGDDCAKYLLLSNTHSGQGSVIVKFTAVRVVCQNTLMMSLQDGQRAFRVRHSRRMTDRLDEISHLIGEINAAYARVAEAFQRFAKVQIKNESMLDEYLSALFPQSPAQQREGRKPPKLLEVRRRFETQPDLQEPGVRGSLWAAYNAVTGFEDYRRARDETAQKRLDRVWFGAGAELKAKAFDEALRMAEAA
jgi:phage/plasmid-like protein (TIGR03299 family)